MRVDPRLLSILVCPSCRRRIEARVEDGILLCARCNLVFPVRAGRPVMLIEAAREGEQEPS